MPPIATGFRGKLFLRYTPSKACPWIAIGHFYSHTHRKRSATGILLHICLATGGGVMSVGSQSRSQLISLKTPAGHHQLGVLWLSGVSQVSGMEKQPNENAFGGISCRRPGRYPGHPGPKTLSPHRKQNLCCADVLDPKARTSMTRGGLRKNVCKKTSG